MSSNTSNKPKNPVTIESRDGVLVAVYETFVLRILFSDGTVLDVVTHQDDNRVRGAILDYAHKERIEGVALLSLPSTEPAPKKRVVKKTS